MTGAGTAATPRQTDDGQAAVLASAIDAAIAGCVAEGALPAAGYAAGKAMQPTPKQRKRLPTDIR